MEETQLLPRGRVQPRESQLLCSGSSWSGGGDGPCSEGTLAPIETPYPDLALNSDGPELESQL